MVCLLAMFALARDVWVRAFFWRARSFSLARLRNLELSADLWLQKTYRRQLKTMSRPVLCPSFPFSSSLGMFI